MRPNQLLLRCFAEREDGLWVAYCLDLSLAAQADSLAEVKHKLDQQVREYVADALAGQDRKHATYLMTRRAPLGLWARYYFARLMVALNGLIHSQVPREEKVFREPVPMVPAGCR